MSFLSARWIVLAALFSSFETAAAQTSPLQFTVTNTITWPPELGTPTYKRVIVGDFNGDTLRDAVVQAGNQAVYMYSPQDWNQTVTLSGTMNDIDTAPRTGSGGWDSIAAVSSSGLQLYAYNTGTNTFSASLVSGSTPWLNAKIVRSADINGGNVCDYVGVGSDSRTVIVRVDVSGAPVQTTFTSAYDILDVVLCQWDSDAPLEIACLDTHGVDVYEQNGTLVAWFANNGVAGDALTVLKVSNDTKDHLAWVQKVAVGSSAQTLCELSRRDGKVTITSPATLPASNTYLSIAAADSTGGGSGGPDGNSELVVSRAEYYSALVLQNLGSIPGSPNFTLATNPQSPYWGWATSAAQDLQGVPTPPTLPLAFTDIDGDSIPDLFVPVRVGATGNLVRFLRGQKQNVTNLTSGQVYASANMPDYVSPSGMRSLTPILTFPFSSSWGGNSPPGSNVLEVVLWQEVDGVLQSPSIGHSYYWLSGANGPANPGALNPVISIPETQSCFGDHTVYWLESRYATYDTGTGRFTKTWETYVSYLATNKATAEGYIDPDTSVVRCVGLSACCVCLEDCGPATGTNGITHSPVLVTRPRIAPAGNGVPLPRPPTQGTWGT